MPRRIHPSEVKNTIRASTLRQRIEQRRRERNEDGPTISTDVGDASGTSSIWEQEEARENTVTAADMASMVASATGQTPSNLPGQVILLKKIHLPSLQNISQQHQRPYQP